jgi:CheY-like chemotaxis protein
VADDDKRRRKILIVEDHEETRILYGEYFDGVGYQVETASSGNEGIAAALRMQPDVIVLDLAMPRLDGWGTAAILRTYPTTAETPIVACTAVSNEQSLSRATTLGCNAIVRKPCLPLDIERAVDEVMGAVPDSAS